MIDDGRILLTETSWYCKLVFIDNGSPAQPDSLSALKACLWRSWRNEYGSSRKSIEAAQGLLQHRWRWRVGYGLHVPGLRADHLVADAYAQGLHLEPDVYAIHLGWVNGCDYSLRDQGDQEPHHLSSHRIRRVQSTKQNLDGDHCIRRVSAVCRGFGSCRPFAQAHCDAGLFHWPFFCSGLRLRYRQVRWCECTFSMEMGSGLGAGDRLAADCFTS